MTKADATPTTVTLSAAGGWFPWIYLYVPWNAYLRMMGQTHKGIGLMGDLFAGYVGSAQDEQADG